jgi:4'-phosphopantetheinyl transferase
MELNWPQPSPFPSLTSGEVHVWAVRLDVGGTSEAVAQKLLVGGEVERANKFVLEKPRRNFVTSRAALRSILGGYLGQQPHEVAIVANSNGKPQLSIGELGFNLTHSEDLALIAVTRGCEIGVDVEAVRPIERLVDLARRNFHPAEIAAVDAAVAADAPSVFLRCWTRKEAVLKALGAGLRSPLAEFDTLSLTSDSGIMVSGTRCYLQEIAPCGGYVAAVATLERRPATQGFTYSP